MDEAKSPSFYNDDDRSKCNEINGLSGNSLDQEVDLYSNEVRESPSQPVVTEASLSNDETDFLRFKKSTPCHKLGFPSKIWKSVKKNDLDAVYKNIENVIGKFETGRKKRILSHEERGVDEENLCETVPSKKLCLLSDKPLSTHSFEEINSCSNDQKCSSFKTKGSSEKTAKTKNKTIPTIPEECYVAMDCEMVGVGERGSRSVLGRCSIVDYKGNVLYDRHVCPSEIITDFRTKWSGICPEHMNDAESTCKALRDIRRCLQNKVVIGHSVHHDFDVLGFHPHHYLVRDTFHCNLLSADHGKGKSLKNLTKSILYRDIQTGKMGHDSVEDARAALELFKVVRKDWEVVLCRHWRQDGVDVQEFVRHLKESKSFKDRRGKSVLDFEEAIVCDNNNNKIDNDIVNGDGKSCSGSSDALQSELHTADYYRLVNSSPSSSRSNSPSVLKQCRTIQRSLNGGKSKTLPKDVDYLSDKFWSS